MIKSKINFILFIALAIFWSGSFIGIKAAVTYWPPIFSAAIRVGIGLLCLIAFKYIYQKPTAIDYQMRIRIWIIGLFSQAVPFSFLFWGEHIISPGLAGILNATVPIWTFILSILFAPHFNLYSSRKLAGLLIALLGIIIIFYPLVTIKNDYETLYGAAAVIMMAISYATSGLLNQHYLSGKNKIDFFTNLYHQHWASTLGLLLLTGCFQQYPSTQQLFATSTPWLASLYLGVCSTAIAYFIFYHLIREWDALRASTVLYCVPILTLGWDYLIYNNAPTLTELFGVIIILSGVLLIQFASFRRQIK